ncbi:hypothetical protein ACTMNS_12695, partial [Staphylococcus haemolyticus]
HLLLGLSSHINPKPNNLDRRFRIYRETLSRFSCAASMSGMVTKRTIMVYHTKNTTFNRY